MILKLSCHLKLACFLFTIPFLFSKLNAQSPEYTILGGVNMSKLHYKDISILNDNRIIIFYPHFGIVKDVKIGENLFLESGIMHYTKGFQIRFPGFREIYSYNFLEIPLHIKHQAKVGDVHYFMSSGLYLAYLHTGNKRVVNIFNGDILQRINFTSSNFDLSSRLDYGFNIIAGFAYKKIQGRLNFGYGLEFMFNENRNKGKDMMDPSHMALSVTLGYQVFKNVKPTVKKGKPSPSF